MLIVSHSGLRASAECLNCIIIHHTRDLIFSHYPPNSLSSRAKNVVAAARPPVRFFSVEAPVVDLYLGQLDQVLHKHNMQTLFK